MAFLAFRNKVGAVWFGRDVQVRAKRWTLVILLVPRRDITIEGGMILAGLRIELAFSAPLARGLGSFQDEANRADYRWQPPVRVRVTSDAREIAELNPVRPLCLS